MVNINIYSVLFLFINIFKDINSIFSIFLLKFINNNINNNDINKINNTFYAIKYLNNLTVYTFMENYSNIRYLQFNNPSFVFKVKTGNYLPEKTLIKNFDHIINTLNFKTIQNKKSLWFNSEDIYTFLMEKHDFWSAGLFKNDDIFNFINWSDSIILKWKNSMYSHMDIFFFTYYCSKS